VSYEEFLSRKRQLDGDGGFDPLWLPEWLYDFQRHLVEWAIRKGRAAIFCDCGLGKTPMQLVWASNVVKKTGRPVLIATPLAVSYQTTKEGEKFGIECTRSQDGSHDGGIVVTNYERLSKFNRHDFAGVCCDESSIIKHFNGARQHEITEFMRETPYRLLCTATAAPNDYFELGTSSEALGYLGHSDMLGRFFKPDTKKDVLGWGRSTFRFRGHAEKPFWRWVCSWARSCRKPSDLGFPDDGFNLPPLREHEHIIANSTPRAGMLFSTPAVGLREQREERRVTLTERCERAAELASVNGSAVIWCHLNPEGDLLEKMTPDGKQVCGSMRDEEKEERLLAFQAGQIKTLITKPKIGCFGLNWQHCHNVVTFPSHSWEQYYQSVRRCWRFGQMSPVDVQIVGTEGERGVLANLKRKAEQAEGMFAAIVQHMAEELHIKRDIEHHTQEEVPSWMEGRSGTTCATAERSGSATIK